MSKQGLVVGKNPQEILDDFFLSHAETETEKEKTDFDNPDLIKLGFWPGGDRDGKEPAS